MRKQTLATVCLLATALAAPAFAQMAEVKEKPPMYTYVSNWAIPRAHWAEMEKANLDDLKIVQKAFADGTIVGYGDDVTLLHQPDGYTHDSWWSAMSMASAIKVLEAYFQSGSATSSVLETATKHADTLYVSKYYNWHSGSKKGEYTHSSSYKLKADASDDGVDMISKTMLVPFFEKLLAEGTVHEYEIDTRALHTEAPGTFWLFYITPNAADLDKVDGALHDWLKTNPMVGPVFGSMVDFGPHRDGLARTNATYK